MPVDKERKTTAPTIEQLRAQAGQKIQNLYLQVEAFKEFVIDGAENAIVNPNGQIIMGVANMTINGWEYRFFEETNHSSQNTKTLKIEKRKPGEIYPHSLDIFVPIDGKEGKRTILFGHAFESGKTFYSIEPFSDDIKSREEYHKLNNVLRKIKKHFPEVFGFKERSKQGDVNEADTEIDSVLSILKKLGGCEDFLKNTEDGIACTTTIPIKGVEYEFSHSANKVNGKIQGRELIIQRLTPDSNRPVLAYSSKGIPRIDLFPIGSPCVSQEEALASKAGEMPELFEI